MADDVPSVEAVAAAVQEPVERIRHWQELGLLAGADGSTLPNEQVERARLVSFAVRRVFFCSESCRDRFIAAPDRYRLR